MASLVKAVRNGHGWLGIFTADVLPTADSVSSILVALLHDNCSACSSQHSCAQWQRGVLQSANLLEGVRDVLNRALPWRQASMLIVACA